MSTIGAILYDAGRTLLRPRMEAPDIWDFLGAQLGLKLTRERALPDIGHHFYSRFGEDGMGSYDSDEAARSFWASYYMQAMRDAGIDLPEETLHSAADALYDWYQEPEQWETYPETLETLEQASKLGLTQGIISDWGTDLVPILHAHEVTRHLDFVVASAAVGSAKPHPDIFRYALTRGRLQPHEVIYVGDSYISDVLGARTAGIEAVLIDREGRAPEVDCPVITSLLQLFDLIN
ncbi:MAG: HAD-IA family hydrolase [Chloroflexi bacterium]|nr:HAD-IA family hydrolase [Chloroflexota bacterium]